MSRPGRDRGREEGGDVPDGQTLNSRGEGRDGAMKEETRKKKKKKKRGGEERRGGQRTTRGSVRRNGKEEKRNKRTA